MSFVSDATLGIGLVAAGVLVIDIPSRGKVMGVLGKDNPPYRTAALGAPTSSKQAQLKALRYKARTLARVAETRAVSPIVAFRIARLAKVPVDDVLTGRFPAPGTCPYCGHKPEAV